MNERINIKLFGAAGDGITDDTEAINKVLREYRSIYIPSGAYLVSRTIKITSNTEIIAERDACIFRREHTQIGRHDYLLTNSDHENGNENITIRGGIWNGNGDVKDRGDNLSDQSSTTGVMMNFRKIKNLTLSDMTLSNPLCYYTRFCEAENVTIEHIKLNSDRILPNQDGIHLAGFCRNFTIRDIFGEKGCPNDDFIALNADDSMKRQECFDSLCGPIEDIFVENIHSDLCHCFVRLLSVCSPIRNINVKNITGACKTYAVNLDAARYCRTPLFRDEDYPNGVGKIENVTIDGLYVSHEEDSSQYICLESNCSSLQIKNFENKSKSNSLFTLINHTDEHNVTFRSDKTDTKFILQAGSAEYLKADKVKEFIFTQNKKPLH